MKTIHIHMGLGKTGTSTLQAYLTRHRDLLSAQGMHYLDAGGGANGVGNQDLARALIEDRPPYVPPTANPESALESARRELASVNSDSILVSSENFALASPQTVHDFFASAGAFRFRILFFVRSQDELLESEFNQLTKVRVFHRSLRDFGRELFMGDFHSFARRWEAVFGRENMACAVYDAGGDSLLKDFLGLLPLDESAMPPLPKEGNPSMGFASLVLKQMINRISPEDPSGFVPLPKELAAAFSGRDLPPILFDGRTARSIRRKYRLQNLLFSRRYLGRTSTDLGGRKYTDAERDELFGRCRDLLRF